MKKTLFILFGIMSAYNVWACDSDNSYNSLSYTGDSLYIGSNNAIQRIQLSDITESTTDFNKIAIDVDLSFHDCVRGVSFNNNAKGFAITDGYDHLDSYGDNSFKNITYKFPLDPNSISYVGDTVYVATNENIYKCSSNEDKNNCTILTPYKVEKAAKEAISFGSNGVGFIVDQKSKNLTKYENGTLTTLAHFEDQPTAISYPGGDLVYVTTQSGERIGDLHKCDTLGNCNVIDSYSKVAPMAVSFDTNGAGFVFGADAYIYQYENNSITKTFDYLTY